MKYSQRFIFPESFTVLVKKKEQTEGMVFFCSCCCWQLETGNGSNVVLPPPQNQRNISVIKSFRRRGRERSSLSLFLFYSTIPFFAFLLHKQIITTIKLGFTAQNDPQDVDGFIDEDHTGNVLLTGSSHACLINRGCLVRPDGVAVLAWLREVNESGSTPTLWRCNSIIEQLYPMGVFVSVKKDSLMI